LDSNEKSADLGQELALTPKRRTDAARWCNRLSRQLT
jgi:hypothetical protein